MKSERLSVHALIKDRGASLLEHRQKPSADIRFVGAVLVAIKILFATNAASAKSDRKDSNRIRLTALPLKLIAAYYLGILQTVAVADTSTLVVIPLQNRPAAEIQNLLAPLLEADEGVSGDGFQLIVKASPARLESIRTLIRSLDTRLHNLIISVLQNSRKTAEQLNAEASISASSSGIQLHGLSANSRDIASKRNNQQIRTLEGQAAHIRIGQIRPVDNVTIYDSGYGYPSIGVNTQLHEASSGFAVIPRLQANNEVLLDIEPWSEHFLRNGAIARQQVQTSIRTRLGEWIEIGGIANTRQIQRHGFNGMNYATRDHESRILIKVELAD